MGEDDSIRDFIAERQDGLWMTIGMKIDARRRTLWVCSSGGGNLVGYDQTDEVEGRPAGIFKFDLGSGRLIKKYVLDAHGEVHFFNDLVIAENGDVYATHMFEEAAIYSIAAATDQLEVFVTDASIKFPNGITKVPDQPILFVAHSAGIARIDTRDKTVSEVIVPEGLEVSGKGGMDGLYYYQNSLVGVQSGAKTVRRFRLNKRHTTIVSDKVLEQNHPMMDRPTTGGSCGFRILLRRQCPV